MIHFVHIDLYRFIFYTIFYFNTKIIKFYLFDKCIKFQELDINTFSNSFALQTIYIDEKTKAISKVQLCFGYVLTSQQIDLNVKCDLF